jgi:hypothetical protein
LFVAANYLDLFSLNMESVSWLKDLSSGNITFLFRGVATTEQLVVLAVI